MRIFSKFRDYYDSALSVFNDPTIVYERHTRMETVTTSKELPTHICFGKNDGFAVFNDTETLFHIGFCGKWFHCCGHQDRKSFKTTYIYVEQAEIPHLLPWYSQGNAVLDMNADPFWNRDIFVKFNSPILAVGYSPKKSTPTSDRYVYNVIVNPQLTCVDMTELVPNSYPEEDIRFVTKLDPFTAMQELEMFIGNVLTNNTSPTMPVGTDDQIRDSKGFDKWSFRKMKEKK